MLFTYKTTGPSSTPIRSYRNNGISYVRFGMPFKSQTMTQGSLLSNSRKTFTKDAGGGQNWYSSSDVILLKRITAIGKGTIKLDNSPLTFKNYDKNVVNTRRQKTRAGGCVAPKKKGAIENPFKGSCNCNSAYLPQYSNPNYSPNT